MRPHLKSATLCLTALLSCAAPAAHAQNSLPPAVLAQTQTPLVQVGSGTYRKFGFSIYRATLWAPGGVWNADKPYALELRYMRSLSKDTVVDAAADGIEEQNVADKATFAAWKNELTQALPAVEDGDTIVGVTVPGKKSQLFFNGTQIASIDDDNFSSAFFNIWLGDTADEDLRAKLLGNAR